MTTWRKEIEDEMSNHGETFDDVESSVGDGNAWLDKEFHDGYGRSSGCTFTLWTRNRVYFPAVYDGAEWCSSVPRNPCDEQTPHVGGQ